MLLAALAWGLQTGLLDEAFAQWKATPEMRIEDAYKWLFHATLGGEHAVTSEDGPRRWLDREWQTVGEPFKDEPEVVPMTPDGRLIRINLRPYKKRSGDKEMLLWAFVMSAEKFRADKSLFLREWDALGANLRSTPWKHLTYAEWKRLDTASRKDSFRAIGHSTQYESLYKPAYRVVLREFWTL